MSDDNSGADLVISTIKAHLAELSDEERAKCRARLKALCNRPDARTMPNAEWSEALVDALMPTVN